MLWIDTVSVKIISESPHHIGAMVMMAHNAKEWRLIGIYGWSEEHMKDCTWDLIKGLTLKRIVKFVTQFMLLALRILDTIVVNSHGLMDKVE